MGEKYVPLAEPSPEVRDYLNKSKQEKFTRINEGTLLNVPRLMSSFRGEKIRPFGLDHLQGHAGGQIFLAAVTGALGASTREQLLALGVASSIFTLNELVAQIKNAANRRKALTK